MHLHRSLTMILLLLCVGGGCTSPKRVDTPVSVAPPLPEPWRRSLIEDYPIASRRLHETGEVIVELTVGADGVVQSVIVNDRSSAHSPRLTEAAQRILHGLKLQVGDVYKRSLTMSLVFEISPCGIVRHSPGADYDIDLCVDPIAPSAPYAIPEFVHWYQAFDTALSAEDQKLIRRQMNGYARSVHLPALKNHGADELRVWVGHQGRLATAGWVVTDSSVKRCTLPGGDQASSSGRGHCSAHRDLLTPGLAFMPLKELERFSGYRYRCVPTSSSTPESDANIDIEWVDAGKRFAVHSNDPRVGGCMDKPSSLIAQVIDNAGWETIP